NELLRLSTDTADSKSAWSNYLNPAPDALTKRSDLRGEAAQVEVRLGMLNSALVEGNQQVDIVRGKLSRKPCEQARPLIVNQVKKILRALDEIHEANTAIRAGRDAIQDSGYRMTSALPPAELNLAGHDDSYRAYVRHHFSDEVK